MALLHGCASDRAYVQPTGPDVAQLTGRFIDNGSGWGDGSGWEDYEIRVIDGLSTPRSFTGRTSDLTVAVAPGAHRIVVRGAYYRRPAFTTTLLRGHGEASEAYFVLQADLKLGRQYQANGKVSQHFMEVWIEEKGAAEPASTRVACQPRLLSARTPAICSRPRPENEPK
jgi:hypothetical protein